jgi:ABC-type transporter Mla subunit MlaD
VSLRQERLERSKRTDFAVGLAVLLATAVAVYAIFARPNPFHDSYRVKAVVTSVTGVTPGITPVRIAGVDVGEVSAVQSFRGTRRSIVTMELEPSALPIHADATVKMRPRLFLEGNSFVELSPGTPSAPVASEGTTIPLERTSVAVAMPKVLGALGADTRKNLQDTLDAYGAALNDNPTALQDLPQPEEVHGLTGGQALNEALHHAAYAMPSSAVLSDAYRGRRDGDLRRAIRDFGEVAEALNDSGPGLGRMLASIRRANSAFADESVSLTAALRELPGALDESRAALRELSLAMPPVREFAAATVDSLPSLPGAFDAGVPWLGEMRALLGPEELGADLDSLLPATRQLARGIGPTADLFRQIDLLSRCGTDQLIPTANAKIEDGPRTAGTSAWAEFLSAAVGANGAAQNFDGNGFMLRGNPGGGENPIATGTTRWLREPLYGNAIAPLEGTRPAAPKELPPHRSDVPCYRNPLPELNGSAASTGPPDGGGR